MAEDKAFSKGMDRPKKAPGAWTVARAVGHVTFLEIIGDKILYNVVLGCFALFGVGVLAGRVSFTSPERVVLNFGLSAVNLSCAAIAILVGASLIGREFERRTIYVALSHPISKSQFILGKFLGLAVVLGLNALLLSVAYLIILAVSGGGSGEGMQFMSPTLFTALFLVLIQSWMISSIALLFSTFSTTSLSVMISTGFYLIGNNISQIRLVAVKSHSQWTGGILNFFAAILPNLEHFNLGLKVTYGLPVSPNFVLGSVLYGVAMISLFLILAGVLIQSREV